MKRSLVFNSILILAITLFLGDVGRRVYAQQWVVDADFEGGSARVLEIDQEQSAVRIMPAGDPARGWPAWWYVRIGGMTKGQPLELSVVPSSRPLSAGRPGAGKPLASSWSLPGRATWSADRQRWQQTSVGQLDGAGMTYRITTPGSHLWIAWGPPATPTMVNAWIDELAAKHESASSFELARTLEGRPVRGIRIASGDQPLDSRDVVWLQARQHAWESGSSWVARGITEWIIGDWPEAEWLRHNRLIFIVPIMDVDRVATGDGGKESVPHDHNRDWSDDPHYPEVAAVQNRMEAWRRQNRNVIFVDLHNPGPSDKRAFFYVAPDEAIAESRKPDRRRLVDTIAASWTAPIEFDQRTRSTGPSYHPLWQQISGTWVTQHSSAATIAVCLETPWNTPHSSSEGYGKVGASLGRGIGRFLQSRD